jgi:hypothetical protein
MPCSSESSTFRKKYAFQGKPSKKPPEAGGGLCCVKSAVSLPPASGGFWLGLSFDPKNGGDIPLKPWAVFELHGVTTQRTALFIVTGVRTSDPAGFRVYLE